MASGKDRIPGIPGSWFEEPSANARIAQRQKAIRPQAAADTAATVDPHQDLYHCARVAATQAAREVTGDYVALAADLRNRELQVAM